MNLWNDVRFGARMLTTCGGLATGLGLAYGWALLLQHLVQGVSSTDAVTFVGIRSCGLSTLAKG